MSRRAEDARAVLHAAEVALGIPLIGTYFPKREAMSDVRALLAWYVHSDKDADEIESVSYLVRGTLPERSQDETMTADNEEHAIHLATMMRDVLDATDIRIERVAMRVTTDVQEIEWNR